MINKKKILIVNNNLLTGGVQKALINLLHEIKEEYEITLFLFSKSGQYEENIPQEIKVIEAGKNGCLHELEQLAVVAEVHQSTSSG